MSPRTIAYVGAALVAVLPALRMVSIVRGGSALQNADYWLMLPHFTTSSGGLDIGGLFVFQNEHPVVVAQLLYWLNLQLFAGSNIALGLVDVGLVLGQLAFVALMLRGSALGLVERVLTFVLSSALLFGLMGTWNFAKAMSGTAWLSANLLAVAAVYLRGRDRTTGSLVASAAASMSYGTGIATWPAVIATGISRRGLKGFWREWPYAVGAAVTLVWYQSASNGKAGLDTSPGDVLATSADVLGLVFDIDADVARWLGYGALCLLPLLGSYVGLRSRLRGAAPWVGTGTYSLVAVVTIAIGRSDATPLQGRAHRYYSISAWAWLGLFVLLLFAIRSRRGRPIRSREGVLRWGALAAGSVLLVSAVVSGGDHRTEMTDELEPTQELREIALTARTHRRWLPPRRLPEPGG